MSSRTKPEWIMFADGALTTERAGVGVVALDWRGTVVLVANKPLPLMTNTEAEYAALLMALETAVQQQVEFVEIRLDSEVVVYQMEGRYSVNSPRLKLLHLKACTVARALPKVRYVHIPRELNQVADALASEAAAGRRWCTAEAG